MCYPDYKPDWPQFRNMPIQKQIQQAQKNTEEIPACEHTLGMGISSLTVAAFAFFFCWACGQRGLFASDQSIVFDGGYRILSGQVPFRDFVSPNGPISFLAQAGFFGLFGVSFFSYLLHSAAANAVAALSAIYIIRVLFPTRPYLSASAGVLTAIWFYPPFGTPYPEHTAFLLGFPALTLIVAVLVAKSTRHRLRNPIIVLSGILAALAFLSKQNAGVLISLACLGLILASCYWKHEGRHNLYPVIVFVVGFSASLAVFVIWLYWHSDPPLFFKYFLEVPFDLGLSRAQSLLVGLKRMLIPFEHPVLRFALYCSAALWVCVVVAFFGPYDLQRTKRHKAAITLLPLLLMIQSLMIPTMNNAVIYMVPFTGIIVAISFGLTRELLLPLVRVQPLVVWAAFVCLGFGLALTGSEISWNRREILFSASIFRSVPVNGLRDLKWGEPTTIRNWQISVSDVASLVNHLTAQGTPFLIFPDFTMLYGIVGRLNPQPVCWFHPGVTYSAHGDPLLDRWIVSELQGNKIGVVVLERCAWLGLDLLDDFSLTKMFIQNEFRLVRRIGPWEVFHRHPKENLQIEQER
ncbi:MAG: hypothetical protein HY912_05120 [Desulfomonile tiedjei]|uniref:Glycosyltransferase RgtA/B/C/D-like domain-containing protein n=1 Tax=Desulfomonile tiedjei TaxID=2358 RepID=A0A9D6UYQ5_9BACT|nr:hypothetical protein [Desulfomonile tiedjei]